MMVFIVGQWLSASGDGDEAGVGLKRLQVTI
jgi:hypothetical protein